MGSKDAEGMANSVDPDQIASQGAFTLFVQICLSKNLESLR